MSCRPSKLGIDVFTSIMIYFPPTVNWLACYSIAKQRGYDLAYLVGHLDQLRCSTHGRSRDNAAVLLDI